MTRQELVQFSEENMRKVEKERKHEIKTNVFYAASFALVIVFLCVALIITA